jgi:DNA repair photolyase
MSDEARGRGAGWNPPNRFEPYRLEVLPEDVDPAEEGPRRLDTELLVDASRSILAENDSPDVPFRYSLNPYRGCEHGCVYCYARPSHEYLGFSAGLDFESKILVKPEAPKLLDQALRRPGWVPQTVALSGNTDCYQPVERRLELTRRCLEVFLAHRNPVAIITKNGLVTRDLDLLGELARLDLVHVAVSITTLDPELARAMEPRASAPARRLETVEILAAAGIPVGVNVAPVVPGLNDEEIPAILKESARRGARSAAYILLRLPGAVEPLFLDWLERELPDRARRVLHGIREVRGGRLGDPRFGSRMRGEGTMAESLRALFELMCRRHGLNRERRELSTARFRRNGSAQPELFDEPGAAAGVEVDRRCV